MDRLGFYILKDKFNPSQKVKVSADVVLAVYKNKSEYIVYRVNGIYQDTPYKMNYERSKISKDDFDFEFGNAADGEKDETKKKEILKNAKFIKLEDAIQNENTILYNKKYSRSDYNIKTEDLRLDGRLYIKSETIFNFSNNCVLVATLPDGRVIMDDLTKNFNHICNKNCYSRVPALYMLSEGFNPENNKYASLEEVDETYAPLSKEAIINTFRLRPEVELSKRITSKKVEPEERI